MISAAYMVFPVTPDRRLYLQSELLARIKPAHLPQHTLFSHVANFDETSHVLYFYFCGHFIYEPHCLKELLSLQEFPKSGF